MYFHQNINKRFPVFIKYYIPSLIKQFNIAISANSAFSPLLVFLWSSIVVHVIVLLQLPYLKPFGHWPFLADVLKS